MNKLGLTLLALLLCAGLQAQKLKFGIQGGFNRSNVSVQELAGSTQEELEAKAKASFNGGLYVQLHFFDGKIILQPEMMYSKEGFVYKEEDANTSTTEDVRTRLNVMNIPFTLMFKPVKFLNLQIGPDFGYLLSAVRNREEGNEAATELMNKAAMRMNLGFGFTLMKHLNVNMRYNYGLTSITKEDIANAQQDPLKAVETFNRMVQVSFGWNLFGKKDKDKEDKAHLTNPYRHFKANRYLINF